MKYSPLDRYTGGTTGEACHFYNDVNSWAVNWATKMRTFCWGGYRFGNDKLGLMAGGSLLPTNILSPKNILWRLINNYYSMPITGLNDKMLEKYSMHLLKKKIKFLRGYPSALYTLALFLKERQLVIKLKGIFTTAEMLYDHQRELIEERFGCECFNQYGCGDGMAGANECEIHNGFHVNVSTSILSISDPQGKDVAPGVEGEVTLTSLNDKAMPLIRYTPGDIGILNSDKCECGRTLPILSKIIGRSSDIIELTNGVRLNGLSIPFETWSEKIRQFQILQISDDTIQVSIIKKNIFNKQDAKQVVDMMKFHCGEGIEIIVKYVSVIPISKSGKFRYVVSKVNNH